MTDHAAPAAVDAYATVFDYLAVTDDVGPSDAIVCFGSRDRQVPARAAELFHRGAAPVVVTTGGVPLVHERCEADVFADELVRHGVPRDRIVTERDSGHTGENVTLGMAALRARLGPIASVISVAWPFAARRCVATFAQHHPEVTVRSSPALARPGERIPLTRSSARWALEQLARLAPYAERGFIAPHDEPPKVRHAAAVLLELVAPEARPPAFIEQPERHRPPAHAPHLRTDRRSPAAGLRSPAR